MKLTIFSVRGHLAGLLGHLQLQQPLLLVWVHCPGFCAYALRSLNNPVRHIFRMYCSAFACFVTMSWQSCFVINTLLIPRLYVFESRMVELESVFFVAHYNTVHRCTTYPYPSAIDLCLLCHTVESNV